MKKTRILLLALALCLGLCACKSDKQSNSNQSTEVKATITLNGQTEKVTAKDICNFPSKYHKAEIKVTAKITSITGPESTTQWYALKLEGGWVVKINSVTLNVLSLDVGDTVTAEGNVFQAEYGKVEILKRQDADSDSFVSVDQIIKVK